MVADGQLGFGHRPKKEDPRYFLVNQGFAEVFSSAGMGYSPYRPQQTFSVFMTTGKRSYALVEL